MGRGGARGMTPTETKKKPKRKFRRAGQGITITVHWWAGLGWVVAGVKGGGDGERRPCLNHGAGGKKGGGGGGGRGRGESSGIAGYWLVG